MLKRLGPSIVKAKGASSDALFPSKLEFNPPAHGVWNIVHVGMLVPEAHQIYVCPINCMRGVVLTAAEMGMRGRFSCVILKEEDIVRGTVEGVTLTGIADVLRKMEAHGSLPPCVIVFPVCTHHFLGVSMLRVYSELEREFPSVDFVRAFMDPIMKRRLSPDQRLRKVMFDPLQACEADSKLVACLGSDFALDFTCELRAVLDEGGYSVVELQDCATYAEYLGLARAELMIAAYPNAHYGVSKLAKRLGRKYAYLPSNFSYWQIQEQYVQLQALLGTPLPDFEEQVALCNQALQDVREQLGEVPIAIDASLHPRPLGLARLLIEHGFLVKEVYLDTVNPEEAADLEWLRTHAADLELSSIVLPELRVASREREHEYLALGQKAAWFTGSSHFVNLIEGGGLWGFEGIRTLAALMAEAWKTPKDTRDIVPRKGLGCDSCL